MLTYACGYGRFFNGVITDIFCRVAENIGAYIYSPYIPYCLSPYTAYSIHSLLPPSLYTPYCLSLSTLPTASLPAPVVRLWLHLLCFSASTPYCPSASAPYCFSASFRACVSIRQHTSACVSIRQHASAYVSIRQHTSAYVSYARLPVWLLPLRLLKGLCFVCP